MCRILLWLLSVSELWPFDYFFMLILCNFHSCTPHNSVTVWDIFMKGALAWYGKLTWESAHAWILKILCFLIVWGITLIFMVGLSFYAIPLLIYDVMNDITIIP